jgi:hypothetical protein
LGQRITVPAATQAFATIFLALWLVGWTFGEVMVSHQLFGDQSAQNSSPGASLFLLVWLAAWTMGGDWAICTLLWQVAGKEVIELNSTLLRQRKQIPLFSRSKEYTVANIANLRLAPAQPRF